ncbi:MAG: GntR family transcriptional regulator [Desulfobacteraceae bacterium]
MSQSTTAISGPSLREKVYQVVHREIITGVIAGGARLVESSLAERLGVSRTPVREALQKLASEGFLQPIPRAGYIVEEMADHDIQDLFEARSEIEKAAARWALAKIRPEELELLERNIEETDEVLGTGKTGRMIGLDTEFHHVIYRATRSKTLYQISQSLSDRTLKFRIACIHMPEVAARAREGHFRILQAFHSGALVEVERAIDQHLTETMEDIKNSLKRIREESFMAMEVCKDSLVMKTR